MKKLLKLGLLSLALLGALVTRPQKVNAEVCYQYAGSIYKCCSQLVFDSSIGSWVGGGKCVFVN